jgi:hypothetical protein
MVGSIDPIGGTLRSSHRPEAAAEVSGTHLAETILASGSPHEQAGHMDATDRTPTPPVLARGGPSTYGNWFGDQEALKCLILEQIISDQVIPPDRSLL